MPDTCTKIFNGSETNYVFKQSYKTLESVTFSKNLLSIGHYAFFNCEKLIYIDLSPCSKLNFIGSFAFAYCTQLEKIEFPESIAIIATSAFRFTNLYQNFNLHKNFVNIYFSSFANTSINFTINPDVTLYRMYNGCVYNSDYTALLAVSYNVTTNIYHPNVTFFAVCAFSMSSLKTVVIPDTVTKLDTHAFHISPHIEVLVFNSNLENLTFKAANWLNNLRQVIIPEGVKYISSQSIFGNPKLEQITLPSSATVEKDAFVPGNSIKVATLKNLSKIPDYVNAGIPRRAFFPIQTCRMIADNNYHLNLIVLIFIVINDDSN